MTPDRRLTRLIMAFRAVVWSDKAISSGLSGLLADRSGSVCERGALA